MKTFKLSRLLLLSVLSVGFLAAPALKQDIAEVKGFEIKQLVLRADEVSEVEEPVEDPIVVEEPIIVEDPVLDEEISEFLNELNLTLSTIFAWVGGFSGLGALLLFGLRFIKDRALLSKVRGEIAALELQSREGGATLNRLVEALLNSEQREMKLEKQIIGLVQVSNVSPQAKKEIIEGLQNDTLQAKDLIDRGLLRVANEAQEAKMNEKTIDMKTESLLQKLAKKE